MLISSLSRVEAEILEAQASPQAIRKLPELTTTDLPGATGHDHDPLHCWMTSPSTMWLAGFNKIWTTGHWFSLLYHGSNGLKNLKYISRGHIDLAGNWLTGCLGCLPRNHKIYPRHPSTSRSWLVSTQDSWWDSDDHSIWALVFNGNRKTAQSHKLETWRIWATKKDTGSWKKKHWPSWVVTGWWDVKLINKFSVDRSCCKSHPAGRVFLSMQFVVLKHPMLHWPLWCWLAGWMPDTRI